MVLADVERLLIGVNITCNFSYVKAKTPCLSAIMRNQPSDMCSFFPRRHRWCFTVLCWPHAHNDKNFIFHQKSPNWLWLFFLYKASFFPCPDLFEELVPRMQVSMRSGCLIRECSPLGLCSCSQPVTLKSLVHILMPIFPSMGSLQTGNTQTGFLDSLSCTHGSDCNCSSLSLEVIFANVQRCQ